MISRRIWRTKVDQTVTYNNAKHSVIAVYPYTAYLKNLESEEVTCASIGDLVVAGLEPSLPPTPEAIRSMVFGAP